MNMKKSILISIIITLTSILVSVAAYSSMVKVKKDYESLELKSKNLELLITDIKTFHKETIDSINSEHEKKIIDLENYLNQSNQLVIIYQNNTNGVDQFISSSSTSFSNRMDRLKKEDMDEYLRIVKERRDRINAMQYNSASKTSVFMNMDTSFMNEQEKINHDLLVNKMGEIFELTQKLENVPEISNREMWQQLGPLLREARPMLDIERTAIFKKTFSDKFGLSKEDSENFTEYIDHLIDATTINPMRIQNPNNN